MNDQSSSGNPQNPPSSNPPPTNPPGSGQPPYQDWRDMRRAERAERRAERHAMRGGYYGWIGGVILILLGAVFLLQNLTGFSLDNWWALFILIPAFGAFATAWNNYRSNGSLTSAGRGSLIGGFILTLIAGAFLFNLDLGNLWPVILIIIGLAILANALLP
jgi:hypothetical protein